MMNKGPLRPHPAKFSLPIIRRIADIITEESHRATRIPFTIFDPFAGVGGIFEVEKLVPGTVCWGIEIEGEWITEHPRHILADSVTWMQCTSRQFSAVVTSPCYGNRMADHHVARDDSERNTYRHKLGRELDYRSSAGMQWGDEYREFHALAWEAASRIIVPGGMMILNIKDHIRKGERMRVTDWHKAELGKWLSFECEYKIHTRGNRQGENGGTRIAYESILVFRRRPFIRSIGLASDRVHEA